MKTVILLLCMVLWKAESFQPLTEASQKSQSLHGGAVPALLWRAEQSEWRDVYGQTRKKGTKIQIWMPEMRHLNMFLVTSLLSLSTYI